MSANPFKTAKAAAAPPPEAGAHHGPGTAAPGVAETLAAFFSRFKGSKTFNYKVLGLLVIAAVGVFVWRYMASVRASNAADVWIRLDEASSVDKLDDIAKKDANGVQGKLAKLYVARYWLGGPGQGLDGLQQSDPDQRKKAIELIANARASFLELAEVFKGDISLGAQSYLGAAESEEALVGVPAEGKTLESRGTVEKAAEYYGQVARVAGATPWGDAAKKRAELLKSKANEVKELQSSLYNQMTPRVPTLDPSQPFGPGSGLDLGPRPGLPTPPTLVRAGRGRAAGVGAHDPDRAAAAQGRARPAAGEGRAGAAHAGPERRADPARRAGPAREEVTVGWRRFGEA